MDYKKLCSICDSRRHKFLSFYTIKNHALGSALWKLCELKGIDEKLPFSTGELNSATDGVFSDSYDVVFVDDDGNRGFLDDDGLIDDIRKIDNTVIRDLFVDLYEKIESRPQEWFRDVEWFEEGVADIWFQNEASDETLSKVFGLDLSADDFDSEVVRRWNRLSEKEKIDTWQRHKND